MSKPERRPAKITAVTDVWLTHVAIRLLLDNSVQPAQTPKNFGNKGFLSFEHLTLCPIQTSLVDTALLDDKEKAWLNAYHDEVLAKVSPVLAGMGEGGQQGLRWLERECQQRV